MVNPGTNTLKDLNVCFIGTPEIAADVLEGLLKGGLGISSVITRPDKPSGRGNTLSKTPVRILAEKHNIPVYTPASKGEFTETLGKLKPDIGIIAAYGMIIPKEALAIPKHGIINFHPSLLPHLRGPSPIPAAILNGDTKTGVTILEVTEEMDAGDILEQKEYPLTGKETTPELEKSLATIGADMITNILPEYIAHKLTPKPQDHDKATYTHMVKKTDGEINWDENEAEQIERESRAFTPWPGVYTFWNGKKLDLYNIEVVEGDFESGLVTDENGKILIGTKKGAIAPASMKLEGKNKVSSQDFLRGYPAFIGASLKK